MVVLNKIYTRTGDKGKTSLGDGTRIEKNSMRVSAYGTVDEANACFGLARIQCESALKDAIAHIQNDLFDLGADLCRPMTEKNETTMRDLRISAKQVIRLEKEIDAMNEKLHTLRSFILPGGSVSGSLLHLCRTVTRRAERETIALSQSETVNPAALRYLNRLSDWCFCASRIANDNGQQDILWQPGKNT